MLFSIGLIDRSIILSCTYKKKLMSMMSNDVLHGRFYISKPNNDGIYHRKRKVEETTKF